VIDVAKLAVIGPDPEILLETSAAHHILNDHGKSRADRSASIRRCDAIAYLVVVDRHPDPPAFERRTGAVVITSNSDWKGFDPTTLASPETLRKMRGARRERSANADASRQPEPERQIKPSASAVKDIIRDCVIEDRRMSVDQIIETIKSKTGPTGAVSKHTVGNLRREFLETLRYLDERDMLTRKIKK
jgi:hypothetical protein